MGGGGSGGAGSAQYPDTQQLFVGNLPHNCTEQDLEILFGKYGKVSYYKLVCPNNFSRGECLLIFIYKLLCILTSERMLVHAFAWSKTIENIGK